MIGKERVRGQKGSKPNAKQSGWIKEGCGVKVEDEKTLLLYMVDIFVMIDLYLN